MSEDDDRGCETKVKQLQLQPMWTNEMFCSDNCTEY
jgi:hypothetical protein